MLTLFYISFFIIIYTFIGYPILLRLVKATKPCEPLEDHKLPDLTIVLCIYNGSKNLRQRIDNLLASDYPAEKLNVLVISDGSTDYPEKVIDELGDSRVTIKGYEENKGKSFALNFAQQFITTPYTVFTDIRQTFDANALRALASLVVKDNIGAASGNLEIKSCDSSEEPGAYWRYEKAIRKKESDLHSLLGVTGAIYIAQTDLLPEIPKDSLLDDMFIPLNIVKQGKQVKFCEEAIAYDVPSKTTQEEFTRKVRTLAGNFQLISHMPWLLSPTQNPLFIQFISHKVLRLVMPFALIALLVSSLYVDHDIIQIFFWLQISFYLYALFGYLFRQIKLPFVSVAISFCSLNYASLIATWKYFTTDDLTSLWKKH